MSAGRRWLERLAWASAGALAMVMVRPSATPRMRLCAGAWATASPPSPRVHPEGWLEPLTFDDTEPFRAQADVPNVTAAPPAAETTRAPELAIARMPGATQLSEGSRWDAPSHSWIVTASFRVPARAEQVHRYYRTALEKRGFAVKAPAVRPLAGRVDTRGSTVVGRKPAEHAQIAIRQIDGHLVTTARIIWRTWAP